MFSLWVMRLDILVFWQSHSRTVSFTWDLSVFLNSQCFSLLVSSGWGAVTWKICLGLSQLNQAGTTHYLKCYFLRLPLDSFACEMSRNSERCFLIFHSTKWQFLFSIFKKILNLEEGEKYHLVTSDKADAYKCLGLFTKVAHEGMFSPFVHLGVNRITQKRPHRFPRNLFEGCDVVQGRTQYISVWIQDFFHFLFNMFPVFPVTNSWILIKIRHKVGADLWVCCSLLSNLGLIDICQSEVTRVQRLLHQEPASPFPLWNWTHPPLHLFHNQLRGGSFLLFGLFFHSRCSLCLCVTVVTDVFSILLPPLN